MIPCPRKIVSAEVYKPLTDMMFETLVTPGELAAHWRYTDDHLSNLRRAGRGLPFLKLPSGGVRYRASDILTAEIQGTGGPLAVDRICLALAACKELPPDARVAAQNAIRAAFPGK